MILKIAGILYIIQIIIIYAVIIFFETKYFIKMVKGNERKTVIKDILKLIVFIPITPFIILKYFLEDEYSL